MSATDATTHEQDGQHDGPHDQDGPHDLHDHDKGLSHDLPRLLDRRRVLGLLGGLGLATSVAACSDDGTTSTAATPGPSG